MNEQSAGPANWWEVDPVAPSQGAPQAAPAGWEADPVANDQVPPSDGRLRLTITPSGSTAPQPEAPAPQEPETGGWNNFTAGVNEAIYTTLGAPVDLAAGAVNLGMKGVEALTGAEMPRVRDPIGGSRSIARAMTTIGVNDPEQVKPEGTGETILRKAGEGVGYMIAPEAMLGAMAKAGIVGESAMRFLGALFGESKTAANVAGNAVIGGVAGASGEAAGQAADETGAGQFRPLADFAGNMAGGAVAAGAAALPRAVMAAADRANSYALATPAAQERAAAERLQTRATDPRAAVEAIDTAPRELIPGSKPTTFQLTGDMGLGEVERGVRTQNPAAFQQRTADQNIARREALDAIQPTGYPEQVSQALREQLARIDEETNAAISGATTRAVEGTRALGGDLPPEAYGAALRDIERPIVQAAEGEAQAATRAMGGLDTPEFYGGALRNRLADAREVMKQRENALHEAVDPDGRLMLQASETTRAAREVAANRPSSAKPIEGEESAILSVASQYDGGVIPYRELAALRTRVREAAWDERKANGRTVKHGRLARLQGAIERDLETAVLRQAENEAQLVASGAVDLEDTLLDRVQAVASGGGSGEWPGPVPMARAPAGGDVAARAGAPKPDAVMVEAADIALGRRAPYRPPSFLRWIAARGGVLPDANVTAVLDAADRRYGGILSTGGRSVDELGISIAERGGMRERPDENQILDWISEAANGRDPDWWVAMHASPEREEAARIADSITRLAAEQGVPLRSRRAALDLLNQEAALYGDGPPSATMAANLQNREQAYGGTAGPYGTGQGPGADGRRMGPGAGSAASADGAGALGGVPGVPGARGEAGWGPGSSPGGEGVPPPRMEPPSVFGEEDLARMRTANAATRERAETFDTGPVGRVLESSGPADRYRLSESSVPGALFRPGLEGFHAVQAFRRAVGDDAAAIHLLQQAAVADLRRTATRPNGTLDPDAYGRWRAKYADAIRAFPDFLRSIGTAERASRLLDDARIIPEGVLDGDVGGRVFRSGPGGYESVTNFVRALGDERARTILQDYAINRLRDFAEVKSGDMAGTLDPKRVELWRARHKDALRALPEVDRMLADPWAASEAIANLATIRKEALDGFQSGVVARLLNVESPQDVTRIVGGLFEKQDAVRQLRKLVAETRGNPDAREGLRKAVADYINTRFVSNTEGATTEQTLLRADQFQTFVRKNDEALRSVLTDREVNMLGLIAADLARANRSNAAVRVPGQSNTAQDLAESAKQNHSVLSHLITPQALGGAGVIGAATGISSTGGLGLLGAAGIQWLRNRGIKSVDALVLEAMLNPDIARKLLTRVDPKKPGPGINFGQTMARVGVAGAASH